MEVQTTNGSSLLLQLVSCVVCCLFTEEYLTGPETKKVEVGLGAYTHDHAEQNSTEARRERRLTRAKASIGLPAAFVQMGGTAGLRGRAGVLDQGRSAPPPPLRQHEGAHFWNESLGLVAHSPILWTAKRETVVLGSKRLGVVLAD